jgi:hypothetical protein
MYDDVEDTDEEPDVDDIEVNAEVGYTINNVCLYSDVKGRVS